MRTAPAGDAIDVVDTAFWADLTEDEALAAMLAPATVAHVHGVFDRLSVDPVFTPIIVDKILAGRLDLRLAMSWLASALRPELYLEVGVRRGFSAATVASIAPDAAIFGFDMWVKDYVGVSNPGPAFVRSELARVRYRGEAVFVDGDSHRTLPRFFGTAPYPWLDRFRGRAVTAPGRGFDMILVDGDHSIEGAYRDLCDVSAHVRVGGALVFDDIAPDLSAFDEAGLRAVREELGPDPHGRGGLLGVWHAVQAEHPEFRYFEFTQDAPGVAFAIRTR